MNKFRSFLTYVNKKITSAPREAKIYSFSWLTTFLVLVVLVVFFVVDQGLNVNLVASFGLLFLFLLIVSIFLTIWLYPKSKKLKKGLARND